MVSLRRFVVPLLFSLPLLAQDAAPPAVPAVPAAGAPSALTQVTVPAEVWAQKGELRRPLTPADFAVRENGEPRQVVAVEPMIGQTTGKPWRFVIYVDRVLAGTPTVRASTGALVERLLPLVGAGTVEVVVAEPEPRVVVAATRNVPALDEALSRLLLLGSGRDDVRAARQRFRAEMRSRSEDDSISDLVTDAVEEEARLVRRQEERLASWLAGHESDRPGILFLVSDGFDLDPRGFYLAEVPKAETPPQLADSLAQQVLDRETLETARLAAALGWNVYPLSLGYESLPNARRWRINPAPLGVGVTLPEGHQEEGDDEEAGPKAELPRLLAPQEPLHWLAEASGGEVLTSRAEVAAAIARLRSRWLVTYETTRPEAGPSRTLEVAITDPKLAIRSRRWQAPVHPEEVAAFRSRDILAGEEEDEGGLQINARIHRETEPGGTGQALLEVRLDDDAPAPPASDTHWRLTLAVPSSGGAVEVSHRLLAAGDLAVDAEGWTWRGPVALPADGERLGILVENLTSGAWGGDVADLNAPDEEKTDATSATAATSASEPAVRLARPAGADLKGKVRLRATGGTPEVERIAFLVDGRASGACGRPPCEADVDLGSRVKPHTLRAVAYGAGGTELGHDTVRINEKGGGGGFAVRILEPAPGSRTGPVDAEAEVRVPAGRQVERVEFFWNDELEGTAYAPPFRHRVRVPAERRAGYVRVVARLDDGASAEDAVAMNTAGAGERLEVRLQELFVVVTDRSGKPVRGLGRDRFRVRQDGKEQEVATFDDAGNLPLTVGLAIDSSASMFRKLDKVELAAASLLRGGLSSRDSALLVDFDTHPKLLSPATRNLGSVVSSLDLLKADGGTGLWEGVAFSLDQLRDVTGRKALIVYSDGVGEGEPFSYHTCLRRARQSGAPVYLIVTNSQTSVRMGSVLRSYTAKLRDLAAASGGNLYFVDPEEDLTGVYRDILAELRSQYTLAFYPKDAAEGWKEVRVEVKGDGLTARTVSGYYGGE